MITPKGGFMTQFTLDYHLIKKLLELNNLNYPIPENDFSFLAIRGAVPSDQSAYQKFHDSIQLLLKGTDYTHYRCTIIQIHRHKLSPFKASTVPGIHYIKNPLNINGAARLIEGHHLFRQGFHIPFKGTKYAAFTQASLFPLLRDTNSNLKLDWDNSDILDFTSSAGINLHYGKGSVIDKWSAGCQLIATKNSLKIWDAFKNRIYSGFPDQSKLYRYFLLDGSYVADALQNLDASQKYRRIIWGSNSNLVGHLQNQLIKLGYGDIGKPDNHYGKRTMLYGVIPFQKASLGSKFADGIVTQDLWRILFNGQEMP